MRPDAKVAPALLTALLLHRCSRTTLLQHGAALNEAFQQGWTPLMAAASEGHTAIVKELLKQGANANLVNSQRQSALLLAQSQGHQPVVKLLKAATE